MDALDGDRKRRKIDRLGRKAVQGAGWAHKAEIERVVSGINEGAEEVSAVNSVLLEYEEGAIQQPLKEIRVTQSIILNTVNSKAVTEKSEPIVITKKRGSNTMGPYKVHCARNGSHLLVTGLRGHAKLLDLVKGKIEQGNGPIRRPAEYKDVWGSDGLSLQETVRDSCFLKNFEMSALACKNMVQIYSSSGHSLHALSRLGTVMKLDYLPYHFLLATVSNVGTVSFTDMGADGGKIYSEIKSPNLNGRAFSALVSNPQTGVTAVADNKGALNMFIPTQSSPVVSMFCEHGGINDLAWSADGRKFVTTGPQGIKIWDVRNLASSTGRFKGLNNAQHVAVSQNGHIAVGGGNKVFIWDQKMMNGLPNGYTPYLSHTFNNSRAGNDVTNLAFRPFEDILYCGSDHGINPLIVPGAGIANVDTHGEFNPYMSTKFRKNLEIKQLLECLPPETIQLDTKAFGTIRAGGVAEEGKESSSDESDSEYYSSEGSLSGEDARSSEGVSSNSSEDSAEE